jgi:DNA polymerase-3 subunit delta
MATKENTIQLYKSLMAKIKSNTFLPVQFICGDEQFFIDRIQEAVLAAIPPDQKDFNLDLLYGQDVEIPKIVNAAKSYPMMGEKRFVVVREFFNSIKVGESRENLSLLEPLTAYIERPSPTTVLFLVDTKRPAANTKFGKAFKDSEVAQIFEFNHIDGTQVSDWIIAWTKSEYKKQILPEAAELLFQITGSSLHQLSTEIEKICTFKKTDEPISVNDVKSVAGFSRQFTILELKEAVIRRDIKQTTHIAEQMLQQTASDSGEIIRSIAFFYSVFTNIWKYQRMVQKGFTPAQIDKELGGSFRTKYIAAEAKRFTQKEVLIIFEALLDADKAIKGFSKLDKEAIFLIMLRRIVTRVA